MRRLGWSLDRPDPIRIVTPEDIRKLKEKLTHFDLLAIDTETTGLDINRATVVFWSLSTGDDRYFLESKMLSDFESVLTDPKLSWIGSQIKYDANMLANSGYPLTGDLMCTLTMDRLVDPGRPHDLKSAYSREFGERMATFGETFYPRDKRGKPRKPPKKEMYEILVETFEKDPDRVVDYASMDAWATFRLFNRLKEHLEKIRTWDGHTLWDVFLWCEVPFTRVLYNMERRGTRLDVKYLKDMRPKIIEEINSIEKRLNKLSGSMINPNSNPQLAELFFKKLGLAPLKYTSGGASGERQASVDVHVLRHYAEEGIEEAGLVLKHRELKKLLGTYVDGLLARKDAKDRIHTTFTQHVADTSRLSSRDPNLQNQPRPRDDFDIRTSFIAGPGKKLIVADYDQLEMFILAHFSKDKGMIANIIAGKDIHTSNVELVWGEPYEDVAAAKKNKDDHSPRAKRLRELRNFVKVVGFGLNYGKAANSLARELGFIEVIAEENPDWDEKRVRFEAKEQAQSLIDSYFEKIPGAKEFIFGTYRKVADTKYVESYLGRRRWLPDIMDWNDQEIHRWDARKEGRDLCWCAECKLSRDGDRQSVNTIIQGTAADIVMLAMIRCDNDPRLQKLSCDLLLQVHDELVFECPEENVEEAKPIIQYHMQNPGIRLRVPLKAGPNHGDNWVEAKG